MIRQQIGRIPVIFYRRLDFHTFDKPDDNNPCLSSAFDGIIYNRWDIVMNVWEMIV